MTDDFRKSSGENERFAEVFRGDQTRVTELVKRQNIILKAINRIHEEAFRCGSMEELGQTCLNIIESMTGSKFSFIAENGSDGLFHDIAISDPGWELCRMYDKTGHRRPPGNFQMHGLYGRVALEGKTLLTNVPAAHPDSIGVPEGHPRLTAFLGVPFVQEGKVVGMIGVANRDGGYRSEDQEILEAITPTILQTILRKRAEVAAEAARIAAVNERNRLQAVMEALPVGVAILNAQGGNIQSNQAFDKIWSDERPLAHTISDYAAYKAYWVGSGLPVQPEEWASARAVQKGETVIGQFMKIERLNGTHAFVFNSAAPILDAGGQITGCAVTLQDITEIRQAEEALRGKREELAAANQQLLAQQEELIAQQEELTALNEELTAINEELLAQSEELNGAYQELQRQAAANLEHAAAAARARDEAERKAAELDATLAAIAAGVIIYDNDGDISHINAYAEETLQYSAADYHTPFLERYRTLHVTKSDGASYQMEETPLYRALHGEIITNEEILIARNPVQPLWLTSTFAPVYHQDQQLIGVISVFTDITERKRHMADLLASERELLKVTLNSLGEGVLAIDQEARIILINETAANLIGYSQNDAMGQPLEKVFYVFDDKTSEPIDISNSSRLRSNPMILTRDLREVPISLNSAPIKATDGRIIGTVAVFQNISEKLKTQQELTKADKLESLGILAGGIAHDFNNILGAILSNVQLAMMKMEKNQDFRKYLANTVETTRKASELTKQLLTFSKGGAPVRKDSSLIDLIKDTAEFALRGAKTKAEFTIAEDLWLASIDAGQISQVIHNLVINAKQAMPRGGVIRISAENMSIGTESHYKPGNYARIAVQDQGVGIPKENLCKIFDPFFTTKKEGNGLGLATSYSIIRHHEGYIEVESQEGVGTTFYVYLPAATGFLAAADSRNEVAAAGTGYKILLMDDEANILNAVGEMLKQYDYQVVLAADGAAAIQSYKEALAAGEPFDAVVVDLTIPGGMGGQEVIAYLRDYDPKIKAIISSGYANDPIIADYERFGFMGVVSKPYKINELNKVLMKVLNPEQLSLDLGY